MSESITMQMQQVAPALLLAQELPTRPAYTLKDLETSGSAKTAYRRISSLVTLGLATYNRGNFTIKKEVVSQPFDVLIKLESSLIALKNGRRFGKSYNNADINFVVNSMPNSAIVTLDYKAWEVTGFQLPNDLYVYLDDVDAGATFLKNNGYSEGNSGHIVLLPKIGSFDNPMERLYLDCIANGGRSILDAVAIELLHGSELGVKGRFSIDTIKKVQDDMPRDQLTNLASASS